MPKERVCANSETVPADIQPVSEHENRSVNGKALCRESVIIQEQEKITVLRDRQKRYLASLPEDAEGAIDASFQILHPELGNYIEGFEEALHLSQALAVLIEKGDMEHVTREQEAAVFVSQKIARYLGQTQNQLDHLDHVLSNPRRVEHEGRRDRQLI
ncbi:hypothetical protein [Phaeobacter inhibens]|uniref:hypothetical protein n=1 Tax=Phaeobacter inhibens TaxID=221822 RepID=UPI0021A318EE|nr:hypothetical protein [Phaeobacter inhibens]UWR99227.1 hypothetical protein K4L03_12530 [Phaeobacter inhibens]